MWSPTCTTLLEPGGSSSARPQRAFVAMTLSSEDQVLFDVGAAVGRAGRQPEPVRHLGDGRLDRGALLRIGQRLETHGQAVLARRQLDEELLRVSGVDH